VRRAGSGSRARLSLRRAGLPRFDHATGEAVMKLVALTPFIRIRAAVVYARLAAFFHLPTLSPHDAGGS